MNRVSLIKGLEVTIKGQAFRLSHNYGDGWQIENVRTGRLEELKTDDLLSGYVAGNILMPYDDKSKRILKSDDGSHQLATFDMLPEEKKKNAIAIRSFLKRYVNQYGHNFTRRYLDDAIEKLWDEEANGPALSSSSMSKMAKKFFDSGENILSIVPADHLKGNRNRRKPLQLEELCNKAIQMVYMGPKKRSINDTLHKAIYLVNQENLMLDEGAKLALPTYSYIKALISEIPAFERCVARDGLQAATMKFRHTFGQTDPDRPLSVVEIDHTRLDGVLVDDKTGLPIGRPWLTVCIDRRTRCILGFYLSFDPPSYTSVARCLIHAILPKTYLKELMPEVKGTWQMYGVMDMLLTDNGLEFHSDSLESVCLALGITISYCPRKKPWWKGAIERVIGTMNRGVNAANPGKTFGSIEERGDYDAMKNAGITLQGMQKILTKWIVDIYHETVHSALETTPRLMWETLVNPEEIPIASNVQELNSITGQIQKRTLNHYGIEINSMIYNSEELRHFRYRNPKLKKVTIKWNSSDLGSIFVMTPDATVLEVPVVSTWSSYAKGLSFYQHEICRKLAIRNSKDASDPSVLAEMHHEFESMIIAETKTTKKKTRINQFRFKNNQGIKPIAHQESSAAKIRSDLNTNLESSIEIPVFKPIFSKK